MANITCSLEAKNAKLNVVKSAIDGGSGAGKLKIYTASYGSLLATITLDDPCGTVSGGVFSLSGFPKSANAGNSGTAAIAKITDSSDTDCVLDILVTAPGGGGELVLSTVSIVSGNPVTINSFAIVHP